MATCSMQELIQVPFVLAIHCAKTHHTIAEKIDYAINVAHFTQQGLYAEHTAKFPLTKKIKRRGKVAHSLRMVKIYLLGTLLASTSSCMPHNTKSHGCHLRQHGCHTMQTSRPPTNFPLLAPLSPPSHIQPPNQDTHLSEAGCEIFARSNHTCIKLTF